MILHRLILFVSSQFSDKDDGSRGITLNGKESENKPRNTRIAILYYYFAEGQKFITEVTFGQSHNSMS